MALIDAKGIPLVYKRAIAGADFVDSRAFDRMSHRIDPQVAIGHNRAATRGGVFDESAHPFHVGHIILAHNGTLTNHKSLHKGNDFGVDSEYIAWSFNEIGVKATLLLIRGAFALTWYDTDTGLFNVVRNEERELSYALDKKRDTILYASEGEMLNWLASRNDFDLEDYWFKDFEAGIWYTINPEDLVIEEEKVEFAPKYPNSWTPNQQKNMMRTSGQNGNKTAGDVIVLPSGTKATGKNTTFEDGLKDIGMAVGDNIHMRYMYTDDKGVFVFTIPEWSCVSTDLKVIIRHFYEKPAYIEANKNKLFEGDVKGCVHIAGSDRYIVYVNDVSVSGMPEKKSEGDDSEEELCPGPRGESVSLREWNQLTRCGCAICSGNIMPSDVGKIRWTNDRAPVCIDCISDYWTTSCDIDLATILEDL